MKVGEGSKAGEGSKNRAINLAKK